jgi:hypothetical protein
MKLLLRFCLLVIFIISYFSSLSNCQNQLTSDEKFIKVCSYFSFGIPPFAVIETEISNGFIRFYNILPLRSKINENCLLLYDSYRQDTITIQIKQIEFDSISNFINSSGILGIDTSYFKSGTNLIVDTNGVDIIENIGEASLKYLIVTSNRSITLPVYDADNYNVPDLLKKFDKIFTRLSRKYSPNKKQPTSTK